MNPSTGSKEEAGKKPATVPQAAKVMAQLGKADRMTMQRLAAGMAHDMGAADLTQLNRFDFCKFLKVPIPFSHNCMLDCLEYEIAVDNETPLIELLHKVGGDNFSGVNEGAKGPDQVRLIVVMMRDKDFTLTSVRKAVEAFDLKLASAREMASFSLCAKGVMPLQIFGVPFSLCGMDSFIRPVCFPHLVFFPCSGSPTNALNGIEHQSAHNEDFEGERSEGWKESPRAYLVRRMTQQEICNRQDLP